ncbi:ABC transporter permease [Pseudonocardia sp. MH-G8]|nr:ABC transporter permease [Pseudonocardia sp. MH-G8]
MPAPLTQCLERARKDLRLERRAGEALLVTAPFGAVALLLAPLAVGVDTPLLRELGPALYWLVVLLFGVLVTLRASAVDGPAQLALLRLAGVGPRVRLAGRALANGVLLLGFRLLLAPVAVLLYDPDLSGWPCRRAARRVVCPLPGGDDMTVFGRRLPLVTGIAGAAGLTAAMLSPPDHLQGELVRLMYVHVPAA